MTDEPRVKSRCRRESMTRTNSSLSASCSSINSIDTIGSTGSRVRPRRHHLHRAASNRKIGRTISSSSFLQHKRMKLQRRVQKTISGSREAFRNQHGGNDGASSSTRSLGARSHQGNSIRDMAGDGADQPQASLAPNARRGMERAFSSDELLSRLVKDENEFNLDDFVEKKTSKEVDAESTIARKATLAPATTSLIGAVASNYEKALAKVSHLFLSTEESDDKKSEEKKSSKSSKKRTGRSRLAAVSSNYDEALAKAVERFNVQ